MQLVIRGNGEKQKKMRKQYKAGNNVILSSTMKDQETFVCESFEIFNTIKLKELKLVRKLDICVKPTILSMGYLKFL